jgi:hypothetical protein
MLPFTPPYEFKQYLNTSIIQTAVKDAVFNGGTPASTSKDEPSFM